MPTLKNKSILNGFYDVTNIIQTTLNGDPFINTVTFGDLFDVDLKKQTIFPLAHLIVSNATLNDNIWTFTFDLLLMDLVDEVKEYVPTAEGVGGPLAKNEIFQGATNEQDILNTQLAVANRLFELLRRGRLNSDLYQLEGTPSCQPFMDRFENKLTGWSCSFTIITPNTMSIC